MLQEILETIAYFERNIGSKPQELIIDGHQFDCLLLDLSKRNHYFIPIKDTEHRRAGIILEGVKISWTNEEHETY